MHTFKVELTLEDYWVLRETTTSATAVQDMIKL
jgi:hypothetical protein